jgi:diguanylate cyclase (GGDEF)-like protein
MSGCAEEARRVPQIPGLETLQTPGVIPALAAAGGVTLGLLAGILLGRRRKAGRQQPDDEARDLRKTLALMQNESRSLSTFLMTLPDLARQLNEAKEKRGLPSILTACISQLFEAEHVLVYLAGADSRTLILAGGKGMAEPQQNHRPVAFGQGRIGWVAEHQIAMDEGDFKARAREIGTDASLPCRVELAAPMVSKQQTTLGVIALSGLIRRPRNEKNMLRMVADLGSIAMQNITMFALIQESASVDGLTGIANKKCFLDRMAVELLKAGKEHRPLSLFLFDIDHFKNYNDTNGHLAGDEALKIMGRLIRGLTRTEDLPARYGGEEFVVLLPNTDKNGALRFAEKLRRGVETNEWPNATTQPLGRVTISGGVASFPEDGPGTAELIRSADAALYQCKRNGRNQVLGFESRDRFETTKVS